eukprot:15079646-Alexandrium_andersonii.AAC.1
MQSRVTRSGDSSSKDESVVPEDAALGLVAHLLRALALGLMTDNLQVGHVLVDRVLPVVARGGVAGARCAE